jgi:hypothetical protein
MKEEADVESVCEVCGKSTAKTDGLLCSDCSRGFELVLELLHSHPELVAQDLEHVKDIFEWRMKKMGLRPPELGQRGGPKPKRKIEEEAFAIPPLP